MVNLEGVAAQRAEEGARLRFAAHEAATYAYCPYSGLGVGAAGLVGETTGVGKDSSDPSAPGGATRLVTGCNIENASFGLTLCAECSLVADLFRSGGGRLLAVAVVDSFGRALAPCGRCRQVLYEHGGSELIVYTATGPRTLAALLPGAFGPEDLP